MLKVKVENPAALHFILQDDIYLLNADKDLYYSAILPPPEIKTEQPVFNYLGLNKKNFLILVHYPGHQFILDTHQTALESVLNRKSHALDDVAILNMHNYTGAELNHLLTYFEPKTMLILGQKAIPAGLDKPVFNTTANAGAYNLLYTFSFDEMMSSNENKKAFWDQVKTL